MKVLHVTPSVSPIHGGTTAAILGMVKALKNQGISVEILTTNDDGEKVLDVPIQKKVIYNGVPCIFCNCLPYLPRYAISNDLAQWLWQQITNYDLIHIHCVFSYSSTVAMTIARIQQKQFIVTPHGMLCDWSLRQHSRLKKAYLQMIGYDNLNRARIIHFTADQERLEAQVLSLKTESTTIPLGLDIPMIIPDASVRVRKLLGISDNAPLILFLSRIHPKKGLDYLIRALAKISSQFPFHLIIAGDGTEEDKQIIYELIDDFQLKDKTHFLGFVQGENKNLLLQGSSLFALTSHSENFGIVVIEAMAAGLPILVTPGVALSNVIRDNDFGYVPDLDADDIAKDIQRFLTAEYTTENKSINERSKNYIKDNYSWNTISKKMINVYQQILN